MLGPGGTDFAVLQIGREVQKTGINRTRKIHARNKKGDGIMEKTPFEQETTPFRRLPRLCKRRKPRVFDTALKDLLYGAPHEEDSRSVEMLFDDPAEETEE
jgi:hypothetical protein